MAREIIKKDINAVKKLLKKVLQVNEYKNIERMGGLTNHTYRVTLENDELYVIRIPGDGTEEMIARKDERISTKLACDLGIDAKLLYFGDDGSKVTKHISNAITMNKDLIKEDKHIKQVAKILKKLHSCCVDTHVPFEVFDMAKGYEKIISNNKVSMFGDYEQIKEKIMLIKEEMDSLIEIKKVPCHNDPLCENWVEGDEKMYLIDWEYAGMNDGMWDLADVSIEACFDHTLEEKLLQEYLNREITLLDWKHFLGNKIYVDYLWTLWAKTRVPYDGESMEIWARERYDRLKENLNEYEKLKGEN